MGDIIFVGLADWEGIYSLMGYWSLKVSANLGLSILGHILANLQPFQASGIRTMQLDLPIFRKTTVGN